MNLKKKLDSDLPIRLVIYGVNTLHPSLISINIGVSSSTKVSIKNFTLVEEDSTGKAFSLILA